MAASHKVPHSHPIRKSGVITLHGFGIRVQVNSGHLFLHDGIADERRTIRLPRVNHGLRRLVMIGSDGFVTLEALRWLADQGAAFVMLDRRGKVLAVSGPVSPSDAKLRRAQALALGNGIALKISKELITQKVAGQATLVREMLHNCSVADSIARFNAELPSADSIESVRLIEARAAKLYWQAWSDVPIRWARKDERCVPEHWKRFGTRISPLTHSPRLAANPPNALLNFTYSFLEAESRLAAVAMGLDPGIGLLHVDTPSRDSLACDLMEACRAGCDAFVLDWLQQEALRKSDFWEDRNGNCRLASALAMRLSQTTDTWRKLVAPVAEYLGQELWSSTSKSTSRMGQQPLASRLTQAHRRAVKGSSVPFMNQPRPEHVCSDCGTHIRDGQKYCGSCSRAIMQKNMNQGRSVAQSQTSRTQRADTQRSHIAANRAWNPSNMPAWLNKETYITKILPALSRITQTEIASTLGVSWPYAKGIRCGQRIPHMRHWSALAQLTGISG